MKAFKRFQVAGLVLYTAMLVLVACNSAQVQKAQVHVQQAVENADKLVIQGCGFAPQAEVGLNTVLKFVPPDTTVAAIKAGVVIGESVVNAICADVEATQKAGK